MKGALPVVVVHVLLDGGLARPKHVHELRPLKEDGALDEVLVVRVDAGADAGVRRRPLAVHDVDVVAHEADGRAEVPERALDSVPSVTLSKLYLLAQIV